MLNIKRAVKNERLLRALTGLNRKGFEELCKLFSLAYEEWVERESFPRQRARGGGKKARLRRMEEKLFFILFYFKCYPTFDVLGFLFNLERGRANRWVHRLQPILEATLGKKMMLPERKIESSEQFLARFPGVKEIIIDGTERPIQRPKEGQKEKEHYSGRTSHAPGETPGGVSSKKKRHTRKHITVSTRKKRVILLTSAQPGTIHDKRQLDEAELVKQIQAGGHD